MPAAMLAQQLRRYAAPSNQLQLIKELRERTGAPMTDVKTALQAANWDLGKQDISRMDSPASFKNAQLPLLPPSAAAAVQASST